MKQIIALTLLLVLLTGCDAPPRRTRPASSPLTMDKISSGNVNTSNFGSGEVTYNPESTGGATGGTQPSDSNFPNCDLTGKYQTVDVGQFGLCQSSVDETLFKVKFAVTTTTRNCLIPTSKDAYGSSTYIGQPQCTAVNQANGIIQGNLYKNRPGFENYPLNGVIVMKEPLLPEYFKCMHAYINWFAQACPSGAYSSPYCQYWMGMCPGGPKTNPTCDQAAKSYMAEVCNTFKSKYSNAYVDIRTKN